MERKLSEWEKRFIADKRGGGHGMKGFRGPDLRMLECPECNKTRMLRPADHQINYQKEEVEIGGVLRPIYVDVCEVCAKKVSDKLISEAKSKIARAKSRIENLEKLDDDTSLEDVL